MYAGHVWLVFEMNEEEMERYSTWEDREKCLMCDIVRQKEKEKQ